MAEDKLTQTGIRVGGWLPHAPAEPAPEQPVTLPRRLPADGAAPPTPRPAAATGPAASVGSGATGAHADPAPPPDHARPAFLREHADAAPVRDDARPATVDQPGETGPEPPTSPAVEPAAVAPPAVSPAAPGRHSSESVVHRLAELLGPVVAKVRTAVGVAPDGPATRVGLARARRRRRRLVLGAAVLTVLVLVLAYAGRDPDAEAAVSWSPQLLVGDKRCQCAHGQ
ncbi:hypothetical protein ONA91_13775 [Micromonospora sp. DR5-3]|uniref:hypothetical protein n=1 Tax=unclassified Micromonospora TaxID=2617518 RepID=UPI0011D8B2BB|nr:MULTISPECIES: hypothetical protein [unclassified Micromonospora]MCW3815523.1 hypothetical protein [Micromonospora sp. DR5-3]TYC24329.1 hypothetical protein FXF52_11315 [Micromonospora sp. MP36]